MHTIAKSIATLTLLALPLTVLTTELEDELQACSLLTDSAQRLACFDTLVDRHATSDSRTDAGPSTASPTDGGFGLREGSTTTTPPDRIVSRHVGEFRGWSGDTIFRLANGQLWRQAQPGRMHWVVDDPMVTIRRTPIGTYWLSVEGVNAQVRVRRLE